MSLLAGARVLLTGHTGFKGSWLALWLHRIGAEVTGLSLEPSTDPNHFGLARVEGGLAHHGVGDIRQLDVVERALERSGAQVIIHMAAQAVLRDGYLEPHATFDTNVMGTVNVLEAVRRRGQPCAVVVVTSDKCYAAPTARPLHEDDALGGADPYSASKGASEIVTWSYARSFFPVERLAEHGVALASVRAGNVIGGGDWTKDRLVPDLVRARQSGTRAEIRNPTAVRPWQHVLDVLAGYLAVTERLLAKDPLAACTAFNFGPDDEGALDVESIARAFDQAWGSGPGFRIQAEVRAPPEVHMLRLSSKKARAVLGWRPRLATLEAVQLTATWYRRLSEGADMREVSLGDIARYVERR